MRFSPSQAMVGALWMLLSTFLLAGGNTLVRYISADLHAFQIVVLSNAITFTLVWPALLRRPPVVNKRKRIRVYSLMILCGGVSTLVWFYALTQVPLAEATAVSFTAPLIVTALAGILFGERITRRHWIAILVGFSGTLLIVRPGFGRFDLGMACLLLATLGMAGSYLLTKILAGLDTMPRIAAIMTLVPIMVAGVPAALVWEPPSLSNLLWLAVMGLAMQGGRMTMIRALSAAPASVVMPLDFARLPFIAAFAFLVFGERPDALSLLGAAIIITASAFILRSQQPAPAPAAQDRLA